LQESPSVASFCSRLDDKIIGQATGEFQNIKYLWLHLGRSGNGIQERPDFGRLLASVRQGVAGAGFALEAWNGQSRGNVEDLLNTAALQTLLHGGRSCWTSPKSPWRSTSRACHGIDL
jgi:hypothetical protein